MKIILNLSKLKTLIFLIADILLINISYIFSMFVGFSLNSSSLNYIPIEYLIIFFTWMPIIIIIYIFFFSIFKLYHSLWSFAGIHELMKCCFASFLACLTNLSIMLFISPRVPTMVTISAGILSMFFITGFRFSFRIFKNFFNFNKLKNSQNKTNVLLIGAGSCGRIILNEMNNKNNTIFNPIGIIDDDLTKLGTYINGIKVLGNRYSIKNISKNYEINLILLAIPSLTSDEKRKIIELCQETKIKTKIIPGVYELIGDNFNLNKMRDIDLRDLLGRDEVTLCENQIKNYICNKKVLVTGGGGSIGSELCRQIALFNPLELIILDIYENTAYDLENELKMKFPHLNQTLIIASIRDKSRLDSIFKKYKPDVVFHAAAHKHVPLMEHSPEEAIKNNVIGTLNTAECADKYDVKKFVLISTDKAVNPTNVMGATKRIGEMIVQSINKKSNSEFVAVRFGNVLGSNGSVIPLFKKQISEGGPITLTNKYITRYFMLIPEAAQLVLQAGAYANGGEIFVLDMGKPVKIYDLAQNLIRLSGYEPFKEIDIKITGLRPGEKLYEELLMEEEGLSKTPHDKIFIGKPGNFDFDEIKKNIYDLVNLINYNDPCILKNKIQELVPTYKISKENFSLDKNNK